MKAYIARDEDNLVYLYKNKPGRYGESWFPSDTHYMPMDDEDIPDNISISWEDEPIEVELTINKIK